MPYNDDTQQWEIESRNEKLLRVLAIYNKLVPGANMNESTIKGSGLEAVLYTYLEYDDFIQTGIIDLQAKMIFQIKNAQIQLLRPAVVKDNIPIIAKEKFNLDLAVFDLNDSKMNTLAEGIYLIVKHTLTDIKEKEALSYIAKNCIVAGVIMQGNITFDTTLSSGQTLQVKYTQATQLPFSIKIDVKRKEAVEDNAELTNKIIQEVVNYFAESYKIGNDFSSADIQFVLTNKYRNILKEVEVFYKKDAETGYTMGSCVIPYDKFISITNTDITVEFK